jgi:hypothetical protein
LNINSSWMHVPKYCPNNWSVGERPKYYHKHLFYCAPDHVDQEYL